MQDQLLISKTIFEDCRKRRKNLTITLVDCEKGFDGVPHSWIEKSVESMNNKIIKF
jgi:hypothetical protein